MVILEKIFVAAAFFTHPVGSIATIGINNPRPGQKSLAVTDASAIVLKSFDSKLFVINRGATSTIQAIDPITFKILGNYSVGSFSNPQDLVVANDKAYISRYDAHLSSGNTDDLWVVDPLTGDFLTGFNFKPFMTSDGEQLARASKMALAGNTLYVLLQDLSAAYKATTNGKVAVIDTTTDTLVKIISLAGRNPTGIVYSAGLDRLFVTDTGLFDDFFNNDTSTAFGGIEEIDPNSNTTNGIVLDDLDFGGYLYSIILISDTRAIVTIDAKTVAAFNPTTMQVLDTSLYTTGGGFLPEITADKNGFVWIPERNPKNSGMVLIDPSSGAVIAGPLPVGALPTSMTFMQ
ncbi:MAG: hypothetical protein Q7S68_00575 [Deltaproteobacteria bacterium]|nr:hypothetical protein [Deltaproteobacteria bacterium]